MRLFPEPTTLEADGWRTIQPSDFTATLGALYMRGGPGAREIAFVVQEAQLNPMKKLHGGALMTFADICLGIPVADAIGGTHCVTAQLQIQLVAAAPHGALVVSRPELVRRTSSLGFSRGLIMHGDTVIASADGIWKIFERR